MLLLDDRNETERYVVLYKVLIYYYYYMYSSTQDRTLIYDREIEDGPLERARGGSVYFVNGLNNDEQVSTGPVCLIIIYNYTI